MNIKKDSINYEKYAGECLEFLKKLIQTRSVCGEDNEASVVNLITLEANKLDLAYLTIEKEPGRPNIFVGEGFGSSSNLLIVAHSDTVPAAGPRWIHSPFSGVIREDRIYGRGAIDCKGGIATGLYALKVLKDLGLSSYAKLLVGVDEESGADSKFGSRLVLDKGLRAKGAVYVYGRTRKNEIIVGHRGLLRLRIRCEGESVHSGSREWQDGKKGCSAIEGMIDFLSELKKINIDSQNELFAGYKTVITPTKMSAGSSESIVPAKAEVLLDIRTLPGDNDVVIDIIKKLINKMSIGKRRYGVDIKNNIPSVVTNVNNEIVKKAVAITKDIYKIDDVSVRCSGPSNESYMFVENNIPTIVGFGPMGNGFHSADEYAEISSLKTSIQMLVELSCRMHEKD